MKLTNLHKHRPSLSGLTVYRHVLSWPLHRQDQLGYRVESFEDTLLDVIDFHAWRLSVKACVVMKFVLVAFIYIHITEPALTSGHASVKGHHCPHIREQCHQCACPYSIGCDGEKDKRSCEFLKTYCLTNININFESVKI